ncbi:MAG: response regulator [Anaerolineales bacterium]|nr:response regulator [Anaerolineales bacterium]
MSAQTRYAFVIDDNRMIANQLVQMLKLLGYEAYAAYGPLPAMQALNQHLPDIILVDIHMQGVNGVDLCRAMRRDPRLAHVPILAISSDTQGDLIAAMRAAGANGFLPKPIQLETLEAALIAAIRDAALPHP